MDELLALPTWTLVGIGVLIVVQLAIEVYALVVLFRTPEERLQMGKRWVWAILIVFVNLVGAIVFLAAGRKPATVADPLAGVPPTVPTADRADRAADVLYGPKEADRS